MTSLWTATAATALAVIPHPTSTLPSVTVCTISTYKFKLHFQNPFPTRFLVRNGHAWLAHRNTVPTERAPELITASYCLYLCFLPYIIAYISYWGDWETQALHQDISCQVLSSPDCFSWTLSHHLFTDSALFQFLYHS